MIVSWRNIMASVGIAALAAGAVSAFGQTTPCCQVPAPQPSATPSGCCTPPRNLVVNVPGVSVSSANVSVGAVSSSVAVAGVSTSVSAGVSSGVSASGGTIIFGGGRGGWYQPSGAQSTIRGLNVEGGLETRTVEEDVTENYCIDRTREQRQVRPVQAMCVDDRGVPHPASRLDEDAQVGRDFNGEVYRCLAGSHMQVTLGRMVDGRANFDQGDTFSCQKGDALWHAPGGRLECKPQRVERNCNERSLLRRYGPGVKLVEVASTESYCEPATRTQRVARQVQVPRPTVAGDLVLDGGVGN
jgi:hypothetical protein